MATAAVSSPAIISASLNADVPAHHGTWLMRRIEAGYCRIGRREGIHYRKVSLVREAVAGFVLWTRNAAPFLPCLERLRDLGYPCVVQFAITAYPEGIEPARVGRRDAIEALQAIARMIGPRAVVWRYDPLLVGDAMPLDRHLEHFGTLAAQLEGTTDEAVVAFARHGARARSAGRLADPPDDDKRAMVRALAAAAKHRGMRLTLCSQLDWLAPGAAPSRCIDARRLADVGAGALQVGTAGFVPGCLCARAIDLGDSDGARPCFAGAIPSRARGRTADEGRELLIMPRRTFVRLGADDLPF